MVASALVRALNSSKDQNSRKGYAISKNGIGSSSPTLPHPVYVVQLRRDTLVNAGSCHHFKGDNRCRPWALPWGLIDRPRPSSSSHTSAHDQPGWVPHFNVTHRRSSSARHRPLTTCVTAPLSAVSLAGFA